LFNSDTVTAQAFHDIANQVETFCKKSGSLIKVAPRHQH
jgi:ATP-binding protein involved in chromosome partitioning